MASEIPDLGIDAARLGPRKEAREGKDCIGEREVLQQEKKGQEMGKGIISYENHVALECLLGSILFQHLSLNQDHQIKPVVLDIPYSPNQLPGLGDTGEKEYFAWQAREHHIRWVKHLNVMTAMVLPTAS